ncbi:hypothetical protein MNBD_GAMMA14-1214 [hydrothermal vent metagenome]|uniref:Glycine zipper domain-containing protein n=1 Tax=hydrothermal vent metagenome TaxID=652676 RepID=A0A3B0Z7G9_9ZZZZ
MKRYAPYVIAAALLQATVAGADVVKQEVPDTMGAKGFGGVAGFMVGAASGGPVGAVVGALLGGWSAAKAQEVTGLYGSAYRIGKKDGSERIVRSPKQHWAIGDEVEVVHGRLVAARQSVH